ncbi:hypothetical protein EAI_04217 [Harpegnathos saltator]|uniref:Uncharacterized protein n=1 Tax=Harpegnathos saltator TaxID=610380 RepID=E2C4R0_HARSA|nr:hypothetical protein EAI_04217 [Harpegnathos saltator]
MRVPEAPRGCARQLRARRIPIDVIPACDPHFLLRRPAEKEYHPANCRETSETVSAIMAGESTGRKIESPRRPQDDPE